MNNFKWIKLLNLKTSRLQPQQPMKKLLLVNRVPIRRRNHQDSQICLRRSPALRTSHRGSSWVARKIRNRRAQRYLKRRHWKLSKVKKLNLNKKHPRKCCNNMERKQKLEKKLRRKWQGDNSNIQFLRQSKTLLPKMLLKRLFLLQLLEINNRNLLKEWVTYPVQIRIQNNWSFSHKSPSTWMIKFETWMPSLIPLDKNLQPKLRILQFKMRTNLLRLLLQTVKRKRRVG